MGLATPFGKAMREAHDRRSQSSHRNSIPQQQQGEQQPEPDLSPQSPGRRGPSKSVSEYASPRGSRADPEAPPSSSGWVSTFTVLWQKMHVVSRLCLHSKRCCTLLWSADTLSWHWVHGRQAGSSKAYFACNTFPTQDWEDLYLTATLNLHEFRRTIGCSVLDFLDSTLWLFPCALYFECDQPYLPAPNTRCGVLIAASNSVKRPILLQA